MRLYARLSQLRAQELDWIIKRANYYLNAVIRYTYNNIT
jgi:hypothetical protein